VVVSHDRYFLERVTDHVLALVGNKLAFLPGGIDEYLAGRERAVAASGPREAAQVPAGPEDLDASAKRVGDRPSAAQQRAGQKELTRLERQIARLSDSEARLHKDLADSASNYERLIELGDQLRVLQEERNALEERWLAVAEELGG
jgi:ATP-binding cassette subfamily F protein uup